MEGPATASGHQGNYDMREIVNALLYQSEILRAATELLAEGGYPALTMDKAAARTGVGKATVYRRWKSRMELAAEALDHAGLTDDLVPVTIGPGRLREELIATMTRALWSQDTSRVDLLSALPDTARQEPGTVRPR